MRQLFGLLFLVFGLVALGVRPVASLGAALVLEGAQLYAAGWLTEYRRQRRGES